MEHNFAKLDKLLAALLLVVLGSLATIAVLVILLTIKSP